MLSLSRSVFGFSALLSALTTVHTAAGRPRPSRHAAGPRPSCQLESGSSSSLSHAGLEDQGFTFHSLRHTFGTALFEGGEHPKVVQSLLGHASIVQTMDTYSHLLEGIGGDAVGGLERAFG